MGVRWMHAAGEPGRARLSGRPLCDCSLGGKEAVETPGRGGRIIASPPSRRWWGEPTDA